MAGNFLDLYPGHLALLERVFLVLAGAARNFSRLSGVFPNLLKIWRGSGLPFSGFLGSVLFSVIQMTDTDFFVRMC